MRIAVCDDSQEARSALTAIAEGYKGKLCSCEEFSAGEALLQAVKDGAAFDGVFLDIDMPGMDGLKTARALKELCPETEIVFVTGYPQYAVDAFDCRAFHYLLKPLDREKALAVLGRLVRKYLERNRYYMIKNRNEAVRIPIRELFYAECCGRHVVFYTGNNRFETAGRLKDVFGELRQYGFLQVHQGYLVNPEHISHFEGYDIVLSDGRKVPISVRKRTEVLAAYASYLEEN